MVWERDGTTVRLAFDVRDHLVLNDPDGTVAELLALLREGGRTVGELAQVFAARGQPIPAADLAAAVELLDRERLLEDGSRLGRLGPVESERYRSNLAFFESFASLACSREDFQERLRRSHVLVLGTGGLNSNTIPHLCGLGVGRLTLLDRDTVELANFARQFLYRRRDVGGSKVALAADWVSQFDPAVAVTALATGVDRAEQLSELVDRCAPDVVMSGIDSPPEVDDWVNDACVSRGVPYVRAGMWVTQGVVWSVDPGRSACRTCNRSSGRAGGAAGAEPGESILARLGERPRTNRGIGPVAGLLGALCAFEVLRYLTRYEPPAHAGWPMVIDFANGCASQPGDRWSRRPGCPVCAKEKGGDRL